MGFDVLGAALAPVDGSLLGDRVQVKAADVPFALSSVGRYAHKLPDDPKKNILHDCWVAYGEALEKRGLKLKPLEMVLEKNLPVGSGLGSSACSVVAALEGLNAFHGEPLDEHDMLLLMGEMEGQASPAPFTTTTWPPVISAACSWCWKSTALSARAFRCSISGTGWSATRGQWSRPPPPAPFCRPNIAVRIASPMAAAWLPLFTPATPGRRGLAASVLKDVIAEPYRAALIEGFAEVRAQAAQNGALATGISGSGPTVFVVMKDLAQAERMKDWMEAHFVQNEDGFARVCKLDMAGARVTGSEL